FGRLASSYTYLNPPSFDSSSHLTYYFFSLRTPPPPRPPLFPYTTLFRSRPAQRPDHPGQLGQYGRHGTVGRIQPRDHVPSNQSRSEEHTSELQSRSDIVCRLLLEKKKKTTQTHTTQPKQATATQIESQHC